MKRICCALLALTLCVSGAAAAETAPALDLKAPSTILMEKETGTILSESNSHQKLEPASVTKVMTILLVMEAISSGQLTMEDTVTVSAKAAGMGGSQTYMKEGEQFTVRDMLKCVCVVSANDASVALAEHLSGSEAAFVSKMNRCAAELGMADTTFQNCTGLPAQGHVTSAHDIALMSRELILKYPEVREFTTIWMDSIRDGAFGLANTNKLIRYYDGATGLKTGSTDGAGYCLSATAERDGMELIAVVMKAKTTGDRFETAKTLLNYGFAAYAMVEVQPGEVLPPVAVLLGERDWLQPVASGGGRILVRKEAQGKITTEVQLQGDVEAPVEQNQKLGELVVLVDGTEKTRIPIIAPEGVSRLTFSGVFCRLLDLLLGG